MVSSNIAKDAEGEESDDHYPHKGVCPWVEPLGSAADISICKISGNGDAHRDRTHYRCVIVPCRLNIAGQQAHTHSRYAAAGTFVPRQPTDGTGQCRSREVQEQSIADAQHQHDGDRHKQLSDTPLSGIGCHYSRVATLLSSLWMRHSATMLRPKRVRSR